MRDDDIQDIDDRVRPAIARRRKVSRLLYMVLNELQDLNKSGTGRRHPSSQGSAPTRMFEGCG
jgi:hypothetical protein